MNLSDEELRRFCSYIYGLTGLSFDLSKRYFIEPRLARGIELSGAPSFAAYMDLLRGNAGHAEPLINSLTVNETYFYREDHQLRCLSNALLPEIVRHRRAGDLIRIWCVPCASGEEPYSVAIWLLENWPLVDAYHIEIVGSDIDTKMLAAAVAGHYGERALSRLPASVIEAYFEPPVDGVRTIIKDLRESVHFTAVNLIDPRLMAAQGRFDVIFCRNVLIYFDDVSRLTAADHLFDSLNPGGFICLGHSESMTRISPRFTTRRFADAIVCQREVA